MKKAKEEMFGRRLMMTRTMRVEKKLERWRFKGEEVF
jgi:hypothetical protein